MRILGLDMSTKTGYAVLDNGTLVDKGLITADSKPTDGFLKGLVEDYTFLSDAHWISTRIAKLIGGIDYIYIEQTNIGKNRTSQKQLEFVHCMVLNNLRKLSVADRVRYVDTSAWRSELKVRMTKDDTKHNKLVKAKKIRGKITTKHLAVRWANETYGLDLLLKDNDIADAIAVATYGNIYENKPTPSVSEQDVEKIFA